MYGIRLIILFFFISISSYAQNFCDPNEWVKAGMPKPSVGGFKINGPTAGCTPFEVAVEKTVGDNYKYIFAYKDGDPFKYTMLDQPYTTYTSPGSYKIMQLGSNGSLSVFCDKVEVFSRPIMSVKTCSARKVIVNIPTSPTDTVNIRYDSFLIDWGDGATEPVAKSATTSITHQYADISPKTITLTGVYQSQPITCALPAKQNIIPSSVDVSGVSIKKVTARNDGFVDISVQGVQGVTAELQMAPPSGSFASTNLSISTKDTATLTVRNADLKLGSYCFRLSANDGCESAGSASNTVCTISLNATAANKQNELKWNEYSTLVGFQGYRIQKNGKIISTKPSISDVSYIDQDVVCGLSYCYQIIATVGSAQSFSQVRCINAISNDIPSVIRNAYVNVSGNNQIEIRSFEPSQGATINNFKTVYLRAEAGGTDFKEIATKDNSLIFTDSDVNTSEKSYCYKVQYENACGNRSEPTPAICSILLNSKAGTKIVWTADSPYMEPVGEYYLQKYDELGVLFAEDSKGGNTAFDTYLESSQRFTYRILAKSEKTDYQSYSNYFVFVRNAQLFVPSAFTPNADTHNDTFLVQGMLVDTIQVTIYNRWGNTLFESKKLGSPQGVFDCWDGTSNGQPLAEDAYTYKIEFTDNLKNKYTKLGTVLILR